MPNHRFALRAPVVAAAFALALGAHAAFAQEYQPEQQGVQPPPIDVELAANVLSVNGETVTVAPHSLPWQDNLPAYALDEPIVATVTLDAAQWSSPFEVVQPFGPISAGTQVEVYYISGSRAYVLNRVTGNYCWVDLAVLQAIGLLG